VRAEGTREARAEIIAYLEDHAVPRLGWAAALIEAFRGPASAVNYAFESTNPETYVSRASIVAEYGPWLQPARRGPIRYASSNNIAYRRSTLAPYWNDLERLFNVEFLLHRRILEAGGSIWLEPDAIVAHENWTSFTDALRANGAIKRMIAHLRAVHGRWGPARRILYAGGMVLSPPLHFWRLVRTLPARPRLWPQFAVSLPVIASIYTYAAFVEANGYLFGAGNSEEVFKNLELDFVRDE
jgi:hypothetical protein